MCRKLSLAAAALACLSARPAAAADPGRYFNQPSERARLGGYVGLTLSLGRAKGRKQAASLRLAMGARQLHRPDLPLAGTSRSPVELALSAKGRPNLYLGGRRLSAAEGSGGWGTGETLLVIAGVAGAVLLATQLGGSDDDDDDERCLIEPELCD